MARHRKDLGERAQARVQINKPGYMVLAPESPWIECRIINVSDNGVCVEVGALAVPDIFGISFTATGDVRRVCALVWRRGQFIGARFVGAKELRNSFIPTCGAPKIEAMVD